MARGGTQTPFAPTVRSTVHFYYNLLLISRRQLLKIQIQILFELLSFLQQKQRNLLLLMEDQMLHLLRVIKLFLFLKLVILRIHKPQQNNQKKQFQREIVKVICQLPNYLRILIL